MADLNVKHSDIKKLSGQAAYRKGLALAQEAASTITVVEDSDNSLVGIVKGSFDYKTEIRNFSDGLAGSSWECSCPAADGGAFCKHCVALILQLVGLPASKRKKKDASLLREEEQNQMVEYVSELTKRQCIDLLLDETKRNQRFHEFLLAKAVGESDGDAIDMRAWKKDITAVFRTGGFLYRGQVGEWAQGVFAAFDILESLIDAGQGHSVIELMEHAHKRLETTMNHVDDSHGHLTTVSSEISRLHRKACEYYDGPVKKLCKRLFKLEMESEFDTFRPVAELYVDVLGSQGLAEYRKLLLAMWNEKAGDLTGYGNYKLVAARKALALAEKNVDELIEICEASRFSSDDYLAIAQLYKELGESAKALKTAKKGVDEGGNYRTRELNDFIVEFHRKNNDSDALVEHLYEQFRRAPSIGAYERLLAETGKDAAMWDKKLQTFLSETQDDNARNPYLQQSHATVLAEILMKQNRLDEAWQLHESQGISQEYAMQLARLSFDTFPLRSIAVLAEQASALIEKKDKKFYKQATQLMKRIQRVAVQAGKPELFYDLLEETIDRHKLKVNLMKEFTAVKWL